MLSGRSLVYLPLRTAAILRDALTAVSASSVAPVWGSGVYITVGNLQYIIIIELLEIDAVTYLKVAVDMINHLPKCVDACNR